MKTARSEVKTARTEAQAALSELKTARSALKSARTEAEVARAEVKVARSEAEAARTEAKVARTEAKLARIEAKTALSETQAVKSRAAKLQGQAQSADVNVATALAEAKAAREEARAAQSAMEKARLASLAAAQQAQQSKADATAAQNQVKAATNQAAAAARLAAVGKKEVARVQRELAQAKKRIEALGRDKSQAVADVTRLEKQLVKAQADGSDTSELAGRLADARTEKQRLVAELRSERDQRTRDEASALHRLDELSEQKEALEQEVVAARKTIAGLTNSTDKDVERNRLLRTLARKEAEVDRLKLDLETAEAAQVAAVELAAATDAARIARKELATAKATIGELQQKNRAAENKVTALANELTSARAGSKNASQLEKRLAAARAAQVAAEQALAIERARRAAKVEKPAVAAAPVKRAAKVARVTNVAFREKANVSRIEIELDKKAKYEVIEKNDRRIVLELDRAHVPRLLERRLDTSDFYGPIKMISTFNDPSDTSKVRVVVDLNDAVRNSLSRDGKNLVWSFYNGQSVNSASRVAKSEPQRPGIDLNGKDGTRVRYEPTAVGGTRTGAPPIGGSGIGTSLPGGGTDFGVLNPLSRKRRSGRRYKGPKINLTIKDADIKQVLTFLAREGGVNIIASENVSGNVTVHLKEVPWDLALDMILKAKGLDYVVQDGVYRVAPVAVIAKEFEQALEKRKQMTELKQLVVKLVTVNYAKADQLQLRVKSILSQKGSVSVDQRTNTLIIKDIEEHVIAAEDLVRRLDTQTPQVLIEARIVEASSNFSEDVGIQWGGNYTSAPAFGNESGLLFPGVIGIAGAADDGNSPVGGLLNPTPNFAVNLPAAVGAGSGGGIGLTLGTVSGSGNISLRLSAAEERGTVKIISSPRIATLDNTSATISQGISIPISVVSSLGVNTQFFNAELSLTVLPHVTQDGNVNLKIDISKNEPNFSQTGANGNPTIERKEAHTQLLVRDGDTAVIGGIYTRNTARSFKKVPVLGDIPFLGWLFKSRVESDKRTELILFITPRIINRAASRVRVD